MIKMTINNENTKTKEQNKNKKMVPDDFYRQLKAILDQDEYDIFKTRSKKNLEARINVSNDKIQKLLDFKIRSSEAIKELANKKKTLKTENLKLKESILKQLDMEVA